MNKNATRILILGATGMLGSTLFRSFAKDPLFNTFGTIRDFDAKRNFIPKLHEAIISNVSVDGEAGLLKAFSISKPEVVINCIGIIKQLPSAKDSLACLAINSVLPHRLEKYCEAINARLVHFSTDCVFSGGLGQYKEEDFPDCNDLYGRTKLLGEVCSQNSITLRTSIIGHELCRSSSLIDWFLSQNDEVNGYTNAFFSGLPTIEIARVVKDFVIPNRSLSGLHHLSVDKISKHELLSLVAKVYKKNIKINADDRLTIDRSLNSDKFRSATGFKARPWSNLVADMHNEYMSNLDNSGN